MIVYLFLAVMFSTALAFGLPCGIIAGLKAARDSLGEKGMFKAGMGWVLICHVLFAVVAFFVTQTYGYLTSSNTYDLPEPSWVVWATFLFLVGSFLLWMPVYSLSFVVTKGLAR